MQQIGNRLLVIVKTMRLTSYDGVSHDVLSKMEAFNYDVSKMRIVRFDGDAACKKYKIPLEKDCALSTPRGNMQGSCFRVRGGFGDLSLIKGHGYSKYLMEVILKKFGIDCYIGVANGEIIIECEKLCLEQVEALIFFVKIFASFNPMQRDAGYTPESINEEHGRFCVASMAQWPYGLRPSERRMEVVNFAMAKHLNEMVDDDLDRLLRENRDDPGRNLNHHGQMVHDIKCNPNNVRIKDTRSLAPKFDLVHEAHPQFVSMDRPVESRYLDNVVCGYNRCFSADCANNLARLPLLQDIFTRFKATKAVDNSDKESWVEDKWKNRNRSSMYLLYFPILIYFNIK